MPNSFRHRSFTLIEMLVVVVIIGILAVALIPRLTGAKERASDSARLVKVGQISSAVELYAQENGTTYPLAPLTTTGISIATPSVSAAIAPYLSSIPTDPGKGTVAISGFAGNIQVTGDSFAYWTNDAGTGYAITALMESKKGNTTNATQIIDSDKQGSYQKVGRGLTTNIVVAGGGVIDTKVPGVYFAGGHTIVSDGTNVYTMMDKNLGATVAGTGPAAYGYYYQRGNNFGFWNGIVGYTNQSGSATIATTGTLTSNPQPGYTSSMFVLAPSSPYDWTTPQNPNLRSPGGQGPCPTGYHIPTQAEWQGLYNAWVKIYSGDVMYTSSKGVLFEITLKLPRAGYRNRSSADVNFQSSFGDYWSSSPNGVGSCDLGFNSSNVYVGYFIYRGGAASIRCFKN